jgi:hypothetical protein
MDSLEDRARFLSAKTTTARQIALLRIQKCSDELGLPLVLFQLLQDAISQWSHTASSSAVREALQLHWQCSKLDPILGEELGRQGSHALLLQLLKLDSNNCACADSYTILELQDLACEIAATCTKFPLATAPLSMEELVARLPLIFTIESAQDNGEEEVMPDKETRMVLIHQVTARQSAQEDTGFGAFHHACYTTVGYLSSWWQPTNFTS